MQSCSPLAATQMDSGLGSQHYRLETLALGGGGLHYFEIQGLQAKVQWPPLIPSASHPIPLAGTASAVSSCTGIRRKAVVCAPEGEFLNPKLFRIRVTTEAVGYAVQKANHIRVLVQVKEIDGEVNCDAAVLHE